MFTYWPKGDKTHGTGLDPDKYYVLVLISPSFHNLSYISAFPTYLAPQLSVSGPKFFHLPVSCHVLSNRFRDCHSENLAILLGCVCGLV